MAPGEPHLEDVRAPVRVGVVRAELALVLHLAPAACHFGEHARRRPGRVGLGHVARLRAVLLVLRCRAPVEGGPEPRAALVERECLAEYPDGGVRAREGERVGDDADGGHGVPACNEARMGRIRE